LFKKNVMHIEEKNCWFNFTSLSLCRLGKHHILFPTSPLPIS
jgi:hypothetical protein